MPKKTLYHYFFLFTGGFFFVFSSFLFFVVTQLPKIDNLGDYKFELPTKIFDRNNELIDEFYIQKRILLTKEQIPEKLKQAFVAIEDNNFYTHFGVDFRRIIAAFIIDVKNLSFVQGASTITQQTAKLFLLQPDRKIIRKIKEILLAFQMEKKFSKDEIFTLYLNKAYMGNGAYGAAAASQVYFSKKISELDITEYAMLAALVKAPSRLAPTNNIKLATDRKNLVLKQMARLKFISPQELQVELAKEIKLNLSILDNKNAASYFVEEIRKKLRGLGLKEVYKSGLNIYTTMDTSLQTTAHNVLKQGLLDLDKRHGYKGPIDSVLDDQGELDLVKLQELKLFNRYYQLDRIAKAYIEKIQKNELYLNLGDIKGVISLEPNTRWAIEWASDKIVNKYNWLTDFRTVFKKGDVLLVEVESQILDSELYKLNLYQEPINNGGIIALNPRTGEVLAMAGGHNFEDSEFNRTIQSKRQPGSAFKPIVYAAAVDNGYLTTSILEDTPVIFNSLKQKFTWFPKNYSGNFSGNVTLRESLYKSKNVPTVKLGIDLGAKNIIKYAKKFNIKSSLPNDPSISLGTASLTLLELTNAYSVFATNGKQAEPYMIAKILDRDKKMIYERAIKKSKQVIPASTAYIITSILKDVFTFGTARKINDFKQPIAGKTGTTNNNTDAWFIGYTPDIIVGVYVGNDRPAFSLGLLETGSTAAAPIWRDFMLVALKKLPVRDFIQPKSVEKVKIVKETGLLDCSTNDKDSGYYEYFRITTAPTNCDVNIFDTIKNIDPDRQDSGLKKENFDL